MCATIGIHLAPRLSLLAVLGGALLVASGAAFADEPAKAPSPFQRIEELLAALHQVDDDPFGRKEGINLTAANELQRIGEPAVAPLMRLLEAGEAPRRDAAAYALGQIPAAMPRLLQALESPIAAVRLGATEAVGWAGAKAQRELRHVITQLPFDDRERLLRSLRAGDRELIEPCVRLWRKELERSFGAAAARLEHEKDPFTRAVAEIQRLAPILRQLRQAAPKMVASARGGEDAVRDRAVRALGQTGPAAEPAIPWLIEILQENPRERDAFAWRRLKDITGAALGRIGPAAEEAIPAMRLAIRQIQSEGESPQNLLFGLAAINPERDDVFETLAAALRDENGSTRQVAASTLYLAGPRAVPLLVRALEDEHQQTRFAAAQSLGYLGSEARAALPSLRKLAESDRDRSVCDAARRAIRRIEGMSDLTN